MFYSPYQTTACQGYGRMLKAVASAIKMAHLRGELLPLGEASSGVTEKTDDCPPFTQPVTDLELGDSKYGTVFDARAFTRLQGRGDDTTAVVTGRVALDSMDLRAKIQAAWKDQRGDLINVGDHPVSTFIYYVGRNISIRLGLDPLQEVRLFGLIAYYYFCLFYSREEFNEDLRHRCVFRASKLTRVTYEDLDEMVAGQVHFNNIDELIDTIKAVIDSPRVRDFNQTLFFAIINGGWFGPNSREHLCVAMEHPPTWLWMVKEAVGNQSYRRTILGKIAIEQDRKGAGTQFLKSLKLIIGG